MTKFCSECGGTLGEGAAFCGSCGVAVLSLEPMHVPDQNPIGASPSRSHKSAIWVAAAIIGLIVLFALVALPKQADVGSTNNTTSAAAPVTSFFGNKKLANEENFRTALADIRPMDSCLKVNMRNVPSVERINFMGGVFDGYPIFMVLAEHGYVERVENPANKDVVVYAVSPAQESIARKFEGPLGYSIGFCPGKIRIDHMTFTEPSEGSPTQMSNVAVSWNVVDTPSDFAELNATPGFDGSLVSPAQMSGESTFMLVLTNEGWKQPS